MILRFLCAIAVSWTHDCAHALRVSSPMKHASHASHESRAAQATKDAFLDDLVESMTLAEQVHQIHLMFSDNIIGPHSDNALYDFALGAAPDAGIGVMHDWYPTNASQYDDLQRLHLEKSRLPVPFMQLGECLHGVKSNRNSVFPQAIGLGATFDTELIHRVGRAIGSEARSIGIHACLAPVLDLAKDPRWGRAQEDWGEDYILTSHMGVAFSSGLSKNGSLSDPDAVVPVMKHFAAHGSPRGGINAAPFMGRGLRQVMEEMLVPFKAAVDLGGVKGVMMAYHELDEIPAHVHPLLYDALEEWGYDGFVMADDTGMLMLQTRHGVSSSSADTIAQWFNAGGQLQFYDYDLELYRNASIDLVANGTVPASTIRSHARRILSVKYDLGLFKDPYIASTLNSSELVRQHLPLTLESGRKSIVLLENRNNSLPIKPTEQGIRKIALIGPFGDTLNYGDYTGSWGGTPTVNASTIRQGVLEWLEDNSPSVELVSSWGANSWLYNSQYSIPTYLMSVNGTQGGLHATYFTSPDFSSPVLTKTEGPNLDWGLYPPQGLPSNNFSVVWEGDLISPTDSDIDGFLGVAVGENCSATLIVDGQTITTVGGIGVASSILGNIQPLAYSTVNATIPPPGSAPFTFKKGETYHVELKFIALNLYQKLANVNSVNAEVQLFWNLVDQSEPVGKAVETAKGADIILLALGANWNSDGESGDRAILGLSANQTKLADAIFALGKPVILTLQGGRPFAIPEYYEKSSGVLNTFFPGQSGGRAIADILFGVINPGGRIPISVPRHEGQLPTYYNYKFTAHARNYTDISSFPQYSFGYGLSYTKFGRSDFNASSTGGLHTFAEGEIIRFQVTITNEGDMAGSDVPQVYLLRRVSATTKPVKQLVAFSRVYLDARESKRVTMELEVDRFLQTLDRKYEWLLETGDYTFALLNHSGFDADTSMNITLTCTG
jgi:beta-glucosidase-like glycosyl hydrolase